MSSTFYQFLIWFPPIVLALTLSEIRPLAPLIHTPTEWFYQLLVGVPLNGN